MICASAVPICCPISAFTICIVVLPSGVIVNHIDGVKAGVAIAAWASVPASSPGRPMLRKPRPAMTEERTRNSRRVTPCLMVSDIARALLHDLGRAQHGADDVRVGSAAAKISVHVLH